jgi:hypothetical protein
MSIEKNIPDTTKTVEFTSDSDFLKFRKLCNSGEDANVKRFLNAVLSGAKSRERVVPKGFKIWRSQRGFEVGETEEQGTIIEKFLAHPLERMTPLPEYSQANRANKKGEVCFYAATDKETAMAEVRPWIHGLVTVAMFEVSKEIKIVDFTVNHSERRFNYLLDRSIQDIDKPLTEDEINKIVWTDIDQSFSKPVATDEKESEYLPTQIIADLIKTNGYDGLAYKSSLTEKGYNIAIFDTENVKLLGAQLYRLEKIEYKFSEYPIDEYYQKK